jgi:hypothetical protein
VARFYDRIGLANQDWFTMARDGAVEQGLVRPGRRDPDYTDGRIVYRKEFSVIQMALKPYLQLTALGSMKNAAPAITQKNEVDSEQRKEEREVESVECNWEDSPDAKFLSSLLQAVLKQQRLKQQGHQTLPEAWAECFWVTVDFTSATGQSDSCFLAVTHLALERGLVRCGRNVSSSAIPYIEPCCVEPRGALEPYMQLTKEGFTRVIRECTD